MDKEPLNMKPLSKNLPKIRNQGTTKLARMKPPSKLSQLNDLLVKVNKNCSDQRQENLTPDLEQKGHDNKNSSDYRQETKTKELTSNTTHEIPNS